MGTCSGMYKDYQRSKALAQVPKELEKPAMDHGLVPSPVIGRGTKIIESPVPVSTIPGGIDTDIKDLRVKRRSQSRLRSSRGMVDRLRELEAQ